jgi:hypothetical protein
MAYPLIEREGRDFVLRSSLGPTNSKPLSVVARISGRTFSNTKSRQLELRAGAIRELQLQQILGRSKRQVNEDESRLSPRNRARRTSGPQYEHVWLANLPGVGVVPLCSRVLARRMTLQFFRQNRDAKVAGLHSLYHAKLQNFHNLLDRRAGF